MWNWKNDWVKSGTSFYQSLVLLCCTVLLVTSEALANRSAAKPSIQISDSTAALTGNQATEPVKQASVTQADQGYKLPPELDPKVIEPLLKQQFKVIKPEASSSNPFPTLVPSSSKSEAPDSAENKYNVLFVKEFDDKGFFRYQKILIVTVNTIFLEARIMTSNRSTGMFAFDGKDLTYLNGKDSAANVTTVLRKENRSLTELDPEALANFFTTTILRQGNDRVDLVQSPTDILQWDRPNAAVMNEKIKKMGIKRTYACTVDKAELEKWKGKFIKPKLSYDAKTGWRCHFVGLLGWMNTIRVPFSLVEYDILISPKFDIKVDSHIVSAKIMS